MSSHLPPPPPCPRTLEELEEQLSRPTDAVVDALRQLDGDLIFLGVGGKMGPTMARMARRACDLAGGSRTIVGVSRFRDPAVRQRLEQWGVRTRVCDLLDERQVAALPDAAGVVSLSGYKFGTRDAPHLAWATNCCIPDLICRRYRGRPLVAFSTGNVYGMVPRESGGSRETDPPRPDGEYAMAALGRERVYEYFSACERTPVVVLRLNYATELRYGVLVDLALQIQAGQAVDVTMGAVNVIWLADANAMTLLALQHATSPARILNVAGADILSTRDVAQRLARGLGRPVQFVGREGETALLSNAQAAYTLLGPPDMPASWMMDWTAQWVAHGGPTLGKPTHFQTQTGEF